MSDCFVLVGRFPLGIRTKPKTNAFIFHGEDTIKIGKDLDSPVFLLKNSLGLFVQLASPVNGCRILLHENDVDFFDADDKKIDLYEINVSPVGEK